MFERRRPALIDNPLHMLIGPMFVIAKLCVAFGFRLDLAGASRDLEGVGRGVLGPHSRDGADDGLRGVTDMEEEKTPWERGRPARS